MTPTWEELRDKCRQRVPGSWLLIFQLAVAEVITLAALFMVYRLISPCLGIICLVVSLYWQYVLVAIGWETVGFLSHTYRTIRTCTFEIRVSDTIASQTR